MFNIFLNSSQSISALFLFRVFLLDVDGIPSTSFPHWKLNNNKKKYDNIDKSEYMNSCCQVTSVFHLPLPFWNRLHRKESQRTFFFLIEIFSVIKVEITTKNWKNFQIFVFDIKRDHRISWIDR